MAVKKPGTPNTPKTRKPRKAPRKRKGVPSASSEQLPEDPLNPAFPLPNGGGDGFEPDGDDEGFEPDVGDEMQASDGETPSEAATRPLLKVSVRSLVAFTMPDDTAWAYVSYADMREGSRIHQQLQRQLAEAGPYRAEVTLSHTYEVLNRNIEVSGRADGLFNEQTPQATLHEIKSTAVPLADIPATGIPAHWAQLQCYAALFMEENACDTVPARLTYVHRSSGETRSLDRLFTRTELARGMLDMLKPYVRREKDQAAWRLKRDLSIQSLQLPFAEGFRKGQKLLAYNVYRCIGDNRRLFAQAPTGTGKTMGALYPALKAMGEGHVDRLFYVTAKTTTKGIAENTVSLLRDAGLRLKVITLTAKDKMCLMPVKNCDPAICPYAEGILTRMQRVGKTLLKSHDALTRDLIYETGRKHEVCPFELSLELSLGCDLIIADYNYVFDPRVYLKRFFAQKGHDNTVILVDEAHNLVDRAREMYSATLTREPLMALRRQLSPDRPELSKKLGEILRELTLMQLRPAMPPSEAGGQPYRCAGTPPANLTKPINGFLLAAEPLLQARDEEDREPPPWMDDLAGVFFDLLHFRNTLDLFGDEYRVLQAGRNRSFGIRLMCLDPSEMLHRRMEAARACILFSATFSPLSYFRQMLGGRAEDPTLRLPSPFPRENLLVAIEDRVETRYRLREQHLPAAAATLLGFLAARPGNYLVFFPSYGYLNKTVDQLESLYLQLRAQQPEMPEWDVLVQEGGMTESDREAWLTRFEEYGDRVRVGFCVLGGAFGEGIDLVGDRLTGVAVVGVGLPQVNPEQEITRAYFEARFGQGFNFAYTYPGLNRVLQAAGRLIRTTADHGGLLLIDSRFATRQYQELLPPEWMPAPLLSRSPSLPALLAQFWQSAGSTTPPA